MVYLPRCAECNSPLDIEEDVDGLCPECVSKEEKRPRKFHSTISSKSKPTKIDNPRKSGGENQWIGSQD